MVCSGSALRRIGQVVGDVRRVGDGTTGQQPTLGARQSFSAFHDPHSGPVIGDEALSLPHSRSVAASYPTVERRSPLRPSPQRTLLPPNEARVLGRPLLPATGSSNGGRSRQTGVWHETPSTYLFPASADRVAHIGGISVHFISRHPGHRHSLCPSVFQHLHRQLWLGLKGHVMPATWASRRRCSSAHHSFGR